MAIGAGNRKVDRINLGSTFGGESNDWRELKNEIRGETRGETSRPSE